MIHCIIGTRAQLVKMAPVIRAIETHDWPLRLIHTGQHSESMQSLCKDFSIQTPWQPILTCNEVNSIFRATSWLIRLLWQVLLKSNKHIKKSQSGNDIILVHGDTFSTLLGAIMGKRSHTKVAHIESGLRSYNIFNPFPEELNRLATFRLTDIAFCPGEWAYNNIKKYRKIERINTEHNTLLDSLRLALKSNNDKNNNQKIQNYAVCSLHRFENLFHKKRLIKIIKLLEIASEQCPLIFILHPTTKKRLENTGLIKALKRYNITFKDRTGYFEFIKLISSCNFMITDGGSNQEELSYMGIPTLLMRKTTERQEGLNTNTVICDYNIDTLKHFLNNLGNYRYNRIDYNNSPTKIILQRLSKFTDK